MRFELFYLNYSAGIFLTALLAAFTLGMVQSSGANGDYTFLDDFSGIGPDRYIFALLAGLLFNVANLMLCKGIAMLGLALAFPLCIGTSMVLGTLLTYAISPSDTGKPVFLFMGVLLAFCAVCSAAFMHRLKEQQQRKARSPLMQVEALEAASDQDSAEPPMGRKLLVCVLGGILMSLWNPLVTLAERDPGLSPFGEFVLYTLATLLSSFVLCPLVIKFPLEGGPGQIVGAVLSQYKTSPGVCHLYGFLGGFIWAVGTLANAMAGASKVLNSAESYAIGQCANVAAIFWGIFLFKEFEGTDVKVKALVVLVIALYAGAIALITAAGS